MFYSKGEAVRIISNLPTNVKSLHIVPPMLKYANQLATVLEVLPDGFLYLSVDNSYWKWHPSLVTKIPTSDSNFKQGDLVQVPVGNELKFAVVDESTSEYTAVRFQDGTGTYTLTKDLKLVKQVKLKSKLYSTVVAIHEEMYDNPIVDVIVADYQYDTIVFTDGTYAFDIAMVDKPFRKTVLEYIKETCKLGDTLYSPIFGKCKLLNINEDLDYPIVVKVNDSTFSFGENGEYYLKSVGECMILPAKDKTWEEVYD